MTQSWAQAIVDRTGAEVRRLRTSATPPMSGQALSDRTAELGHHISRAVISDLETGRRRGLDVADLLTLAAALDVAPAQLLFPDLPRGTVDVLPGVSQESHDAVRWVGGESGLLMLEDSGWSDEATGQPVPVFVRRQFDARRDRTTLTHEWHRSITAMRSARKQLQRALENNDSPDQIEALEIIYENALKQTAAHRDTMAGLGMTVGDGLPRG
ncbi:MULTISPECIES: XRE family transcriptional regulator [unclassified Rhodococcus (in: high G+C Gram-positive bacteria)]|uniref:XRE family transcriptional regulator n=1 Tax=unclassified Rhodococcus (in: high G+C Gram-positive bacteria) TaxID=192944 RepID=UPI000B179C1C|nr:MULTISPECIES: XRE family transcriptional regulator [unclassified Rhodococcus (in: high G+C Gram-positive bacteria)]